MEEEALDRLRKLTQALLTVLYQEVPPRGIVGTMALSIVEAATVYAPECVGIEMAKYIVDAAKMRAAEEIMTQVEEES